MKVDEALPLLETMRTVSYNAQLRFIRIRGQVAHVGDPIKANQRMVWSALCGKVKVGHVGSVTGREIRFYCKKWRDVGEGLLALGISRC
jgi:hypothetical protein